MSVIGHCFIASIKFVIRATVLEYSLFCVSILYKLPHFSLDIFLSLAMKVRLDCSPFLLIDL
jgi:hypothetical protein